jgi:hypothetical protein
MANPSFGGSEGRDQKGENEANVAAREPELSVFAGLPPFFCDQVEGRRKEQPLRLGVFSLLSLKACTGFGLDY